MRFSISHFVLFFNKNITYHAFQKIYIVFIMSFIIETFYMYRRCLVCSRSLFYKEQRNAKMINAKVATKGLGIMAFVSLILITFPPIGCLICFNVIPFYLQRTKWLFLVASLPMFYGTFSRDLEARIAPLFFHVVRFADWTSFKCHMFYCFTMDSYQFSVQF